MQQDVIEGFRLSPQQTRLWFEQIDSNAYHAQCSILIEGHLDQAILNEALTDVIDRHEMLRTTYYRLPGVKLPVQVISDEARFSPPVLLDLRELDEAEQQARLQDLRAEERRRAFDLEAGPLLSLHLAVLSERRYCLIADLPALCADSTTLRNLSVEIGRSYDALLNGLTVSGEPLQYAQFAEWQLEMISSQEPITPAESPIEHDAPAMVSLPFEAKLGATPFEPSRLDLTLEPDLQRAILAANSESGGSLKSDSSNSDSLNSFFLACWLTFIHRLTSLPEIAISYLADGRQFEELQSTFGLLAAPVPTKAYVAGNNEFSEVQSRAKELIDEARTRPAAAVLETSAHPDQDESESLPIAYEFEERLAPPAQPGVGFSLIDLYCCSYRSKLKLVCVRESENVKAEIHYDSSIFSEMTVAGFAQVFKQIVRDATSNPLKRIADLNVIDDAERRDLLESLSGPQSDYPRTSCLHHLIEQQVQLNPDGIAVEFAGHETTYFELNVRANQLAHYLRSCGVGPEVRVGICLERSVEMMIALLGVLKSGGVYVPIDPSDPEERLTHILLDAQVKVLLTQQKTVELLPARVPKTICLDVDWQLIDPKSQENPETNIDADNLAYVIYTSGSTGKPKGTLITHRGAVNYLWWARDFYQVGAGDGALVFSPITFDMVVTSLFAPLMVGKRVRLTSEAPGIDGLAASLKTYRGLSFVKMTPAHLEILAQEMAGQEVADWTRGLIIGGEALTAESIAFWRANAPRTRIFNEYGPTETVVGCCVYEVSDQTPATGAVSIGSPTANTQLYVLDQKMRLVPRGVVGELFISGDGVARGYHNRADLTAERFLPDPFSATPGARMYKTGDLTHIDADGCLEYLGRNDEQLKIRGYRIEPGEIETVLRQHPAVRDALVLAREEKLGEKRLVAYVVPKRKTTVSIGELRSFMKTLLPDYMVPAYFLKLEALPLASSGKVDRRALPSPDGVRPEIDELYIPPRMLLEEALCAIWAEVLGLERVGIDDNFFALGGDSIRTIQVRAKALQKGLNIENQHLFQHHTIRELARVVAFADAGAIEPVKTEAFELVSAADRMLMNEEIEDAYPLTQLQAGMIFHTEFNPDSAVYHDLHSFHMKARLDMEMLEQALSQTIARHPELRTSFDLRSFSVPLQLVHRNVSPVISFEDLRNVAGKELSEGIEQRLELEKDGHFNYEQAPLHRFHILRRTDEEFQFMMMFHHAILDGWSVATLLTELFHRYLSLLRDPETRPEPPLGISFRDFVRLEKMTLESEQAEEYWSRVLTDPSISTIPRWPASYRDENAAQAQFKVVLIPEAVSAGLKEFARAAAVPIKSVLLAAHMKVMGTLSGQSDVMTGLISNGRPEEADGDRVLGLFLNAVPFRLNLESGTWMDLVRETFMREREMLPFRRYPLAELQRKSGGQPLFESNFNFMHYHVYQRLRGIEDVEVVDYIGYEETNFVMMAQFSLDLGSSDVRLGLNYHPKELSPDQIEAIAAYYVNTLTSMATDPSQFHHQFSALSESEQTRLLNEWNRTGAAAGSDADHEADVELGGEPGGKLAGDLCLTDLFADLFTAQAEAKPDAIALVSGEHTLTYEQLDARSNKLANYLVSLGVGPEVRVGIYLERSAELLIGLLGILKAGGAYVALDPTYPLERLAFILDEALPPVILTQEDLVNDLPSHWGQVLCLDSEWDSIANFKDEQPRAVVQPDHLAYILYTSGSTGRPKGVMVTQGGLANYLNWAVNAYKVSEGRGAVCHSPISFDLTVTSLFTPLVAGKSIVLAPPDSGVESLAATLRTETDLSLIKITPAHLDLLAELMPAADIAGRVKCMVVGGEALFAEKLAFWRANAPETRIINEYGPTETVVGCCVYEVDGDSADAGAVPIGRPIENTQLYILNKELQPVPIAVSGELYISGVGLARGYVNRPGATAERFVPNPFAAAVGQRMYKTGDLARYLPDGNIEYLGRNDEQVKIRGYRIELGEIESVIQAGAGVKQCVVVVKGEAERRTLVAYVVPEPDESLTVEEIKERLREKLPEYMVPSQYVFLEQLPVTSNGKVDKRALPDEEETQREASVYEAGRNDIERELVNIWQAVLRVERVGIHDNFFDLGGHSLLAIQVISRVRTALEVELPLRRLFDSPTIALLAELISQEKTAGGRSASSVPGAIPARPRAGAAVLESRPNEDIDSLLAGLESLPDETAIADDLLDTAEPLDINPLSLSQERVWLMEQKNPGTTHYTMRAVLRLSGPLNLTILEQCLDEMFRRHETLRSVFTMRDGKPVQVVNEPREFTLPQIDLSGAAEPAREPLAQQLFTDEVRRPFDLADGPAVRVVLIKLEENSHIVVVVLHQLISDAWALNVFIREVTLLYSAFLEDRPSPLPELPIQYADFARWERQRLEGGELESQLDYWREQLTPNFTLATIPTDRPFPPKASTRGGGETLVLPQQTIEAFRAFTRQENVSLYMSTLAAFEVLLHHLCKQDDICVTTGVAGRTREETEGLIGSFANALVLRTDLSGDPTFRELLQRVVKVSLGALAHQDVPFNVVEQAVRESTGIADKQLFQIVFDLAVANDNSATGARVQNINDLRVEMLVPDEDLVIGAPVRLAIQESDEDVTVNLFYRKDLFDAETISRWLKDYQRLLEAVVAKPDARISELGFLAEHAARS